MRMAIIIRVLAIALVFVPLVASASEIEFRASDKAIFVVRDAAFTASSRTLSFHATVDDRAGEDWDDIHVDLNVNLTCPDGTATDTNFTASLGNLIAGDTEVLDSAVSPKSILGCQAA